MSLKKIVIFPGSQRKHSVNRHLGSYFASLLTSRFEVELLIAESINLPLFNQDRETDSLILEQVKQVYQRFLNADGIIIVSPEYNGSFTPYLKNTIDWVSRIPRVLTDQGYKNPFQGKPILLASATPGKSGGVSGLQHVHDLLAYVGGTLLTDRITLPFANEAWDENQALIDPCFSAYVTQMLNQFASSIDSN